MSSPLSSPSPEKKASPKSSTPSRRSTVSHDNSSEMDLDVFSNYNASNSTLDTTPSTSTGPLDMHKRAVAEIIAESFPPFDHPAAVVGPYEQEQKRDIEFREREYN